MPSLPANVNTPVAYGGQSPAFQVVPGAEITVTNISGSTGAYVTVDYNYGTSQQVAAGTTPWALASVTIGSVGPVTKVYQNAFVRFNAVNCSAQVSVNQIGAAVSPSIGSPFNAPATVTTDSAGNIKILGGASPSTFYPQGKRGGAIPGSPVSLQSPTMALAYGAVTTAGASTTITVAGAAWTVNQWIGYLVKDMNTGVIAQIVSNTATVLTTTQSTTTTVGDYIAIYAAGIAPPPTITGNAASQISGSFLWEANLTNSNSTPAFPAPYFSYSCGYPGIRNASFPQPSVLNGANITSSTTPGVFSQNAIKVSFNHDGPSQAFEIVFYTAPGNGAFTIKVDDQYVVPSNYAPFPGLPATGGSFYYVKLAFASQKKRRVDIYFGSTCCFWGIQAGPLDAIEAAPIRGPKVIVITDSFGQSGSTNSTANCFASMMSDCLGWDNVWVSTIGGTGYLTPGGTCTFRQRLQTDVINFGPFDVVMWDGGHNDAYVTLASQAAMQTEATLCYQQIANCSWGATTQQIVFGVNTSNNIYATSGTNTILPCEFGLQAAAAALNLPFISEINQIISSTLQSGGSTNSLGAQATAGATTLTMTGANMSNGAQPILPGLLLVGTGSAQQALLVTSVSGTTYTLAPGVTVSNTIPSGAPVVQWGSPFLTGNGYVGAGTPANTYGNGNYYVQTDSTHPTDLGHLARGKWKAGRLTALGLN